MAMKSIADLIPEMEKEEATTDTKYPRASSFKLYKEPVKNKMPGLGAEDTEWDTASEFFGAKTPADFKAKMFSFIALCKDGTITVGVNKPE